MAEIQDDAKVFTVPDIQEMELHEARRMDDFDVGEDDGRKGGNGVVVAKVHALVQTYSAKFIVLLAFVQIFSKGIVDCIVLKASFPILRFLGVDIVWSQIYFNASYSPWGAKPFVGIVSDVVIVNGRRKTSFLRFASLMGCVGSLFLAFSTFSGQSSVVPSVVTSVVTGLFLLSFSVSTSDLMVEAKYAEASRENLNVAAFASGFILLCQQCGYLLAFAAMSLLLKSDLFWVLFLCVCLPCCFVIAVPTCWNPLSEPITARGTGNVGCSFFFLDWVKIQKEWKTLLIVSCSGLASPIVTFIPTVWQSTAGLTVVFVVFFCGAMGIVFSLHQISRSKPLAYVALFQILRKLERPSMDMGLNYFLTSSCNEKAPGMSVFFVVTTVGVVATLSTLAGVLAYQLFLSRWSLQKTLTLTCVMSSLSSITELILVTRLNLQLGVSDDIVVSNDGSFFLESLIFLYSFLWETEYCNPFGLRLQQFQTCY